MENNLNLFLKKKAEYQLQEFLVIPLLILWCVIIIICHDNVIFFAGIIFQVLLMIATMIRWVNLYQWEKDLVEYIKGANDC